MSQQSDNGIITAIYAHKGGVGKTTIIKEICDSAIKNSIDTSILLIDCDPQCNLSSAFCGELFDINDGKWSISDLLSVSYNNPKPLNIRTSKPSIDILFGSDENNELVQVIATVMQNKEISGALSIIQYKFNELRKKYKTILLDLNPSLSTINKMLILLADQVVCPVMSDVFSLDGCKKIRNFYRNYNDLKIKMKSKSRIIGYIMNRAIKTNVISKYVWAYKSMFDRTFDNPKFLGFLPDISDTDKGGSKSICSSSTNTNKVSQFKDVIFNLMLKILINRDYDYEEKTPVNLDIIMDRHIKGTHSVYLIHASGTTFYKIGRTGNLQQRLITLQTGCPHKLETIEVFTNLSILSSTVWEDYLHGLLYRNNIKEVGSMEWFDFSDDILDLIKELKTTYLSAVFELMMRKHGEFIDSLENIKEYHVRNNSTGCQITPINTDNTLGIKQHYKTLNNLPIGEVTVSFMDYKKMCEQNLLIKL